MVSFNADEEPGYVPSVRFTVRGHDYRMTVLDEGEIEQDPTLLLFRGLREEAIVTLHLDPDYGCQEHPSAPGYEEDE